MKRSKTSISRASSIKEVADFWDTHDLVDYWEKTKEASFEVDIVSEVTYFALEKSLSERLQAIAKERGVTPDTLVNLWIQEKLKEQG
jgi:hypothetical protein